MEHHSYAKSGSKKWSNEEKHILVEKRIASEDVFSRFSPKHLEPWKRLKESNKIGDFNELALRKQWYSMVQRYRVLKTTVKSDTLDQETIDKLAKEWEFFGIIHSFMNQKTTDLHSYALKEPNVETPANNLTIANVYSCDQAQLSPLMVGVLNDHNFGERSPPKDGGGEAEAEGEGENDSEMDNSEQNNNNETNNVQSNNDELDRLMAEAAMKESSSDDDDDGGLLQMSDGTYQEIECGPVMVGGEVSLSNNQFSGFNSAPVIEHRGKQGMPHRRSRKINLKRLSEKEKYYRHRRYYEQRMEKHMSTLLSVVGNILKEFKPEINFKPLLDLAVKMNYGNCTPSTTEDETSDDESCS
ncbi:uncharacterized protein LOC108103768 [Drosophila eugracilis]|uniref:uncharacterized protein LOC108103768 n=1 Tax=Drosophila eugracilis TaxID=29029 RepID=UPI0007E8A2A2|nr:uncharacterized protein LOC108103768 [Drosophila eugracilis]